MFQHSAKGNSRRTEEKEWEQGNQIKGGKTFLRPETSTFD